MTKFKTFVFDGCNVDPWLEGISFAARISDDGEVAVMVDPKNQDQFDKMDTRMWLDWAVKYAEETYT